LIEALINRFDSETIQKCIICSGGNKQQLEKHVGALRLAHLNVDFFEDGVPLGTAGCLKACEDRTSSDTIMLAGGSVWLDDDPQWMLEQHRIQGNALTVFCTKDAGWVGIGSERHFRPAGVFCCDRSVLRHIRAGGFQDLKEQLVPALKRAGMRVGVAPMRGGLTRKGSIESRPTSGADATCTSPRGHASWGRPCWDTIAASRTGRSSSGRACWGIFPASKETAGSFASSLHTGS